MEHELKEPEMIATFDSLSNGLFSFSIFSIGSRLRLADELLMPAVFLQMF